MDKNLEQAVEQLSKGVAPETVHVLWLTAETLEKTRELSDSYSLEIVDLTPESVERVKKGESTVLQESPGRDRPREPRRGVPRDSLHAPRKGRQGYGSRGPQDA